MLDFVRPGHLGLALAANRIVLVQQRGGGKGSKGRSTVMGQWQGEPTAQAASDLPKHLANVLSAAGVSKQPLRVVLADALVRSWTVQPPTNASRLQDCEAAAAMRFSAVFGDSPADWLIRADYDARHAFLACALPRALLAALQQVWQAQDLHLLSLEPECVALWNHWQRSLPDQAWFGICADDALLLGVVVAGRLQGTRRLPLNGPESRKSDWLERALQREAARLNLPEPKALGLCGKVSSEWTGLHPRGLRCTVMGNVCDATSLFGVTP